MSFIDGVRKTTTKIGNVVKETFGPLAALENVTSLVGTDLRYPLDVGSSTRYPHTVSFQTWIPKPISISETEPGKSIGSGVDELSKLEKDFYEDTSKARKAVGTVGNSLKKAFGLEGSSTTVAVDPADFPGADMRVNRNQQYNSRLFDFTRRAERADLITLYSPVSWMDRHSNAYNEQSLTAAFGNIGAVIEAGSSIMKAYKEDADWRTNLGNMLNKAGEVANGPAGMEAIGVGANALGMEGNIIRDAGLTALGYAMNPQFEMLYGGTNLREFQFDFIMTPRSQKEAETIRDIIKKFKFHASPQYVRGQGRYIIPPSYFDITFMFNGAESEWLPLISTCVLKTIDVDYSGGLDQWATHDDGSPIQTKMTLVFSELEMMHKTLRDQGY
jgi:hypothetical protein